MFGLAKRKIVCWFLSAFFIASHHHLTSPQPDSTSLVCLRNFFSFSCRYLTTDEFSYATLVVASRSRIFDSFFSAKVANDDGTVSV